MNPRDPVLESVDGDTYKLNQEFSAWIGLWIGDWIEDLDFIVPAGEVTDIASIPWWLRWAHDRASLGILGPVIHDRLCAVEGKVINARGEKMQLSWLETHTCFLLLMWMDGIDQKRAFLAFAAVVLHATVFRTPYWELDPSWSKNSLR